MKQETLNRTIYILAAASLVLNGVWMLVQPDSWHQFISSNVAPIGAANSHLTRELGGAYLVMAATSYWCFQNYEARFPAHWWLTTFFSALAGIYIAGIYTGEMELNAKTGFMVVPAIVFIIASLSLDELFSPGMETGTVKWFNKKKGFGFIIAENGQEVFVHFRSIKGGKSRGLREGQEVEFRLTQGDKGPQAEDVSPK